MLKVPAQLVLYQQGYFHLKHLQMDMSVFIQFIFVIKLHFSRFYSPKSKTSIVPSDPARKNSIGIVPLNRFLASSKVTNPCIIAYSIGIVPTKSLSLSLRSLHFGSDASSDGSCPPILFAPWRNSNNKLRLKVRHLKYLNMEETKNKKS